MSQEIELGEFILVRSFDGSFWVSHQNGEAMQCNKETEAKLIALLEKFWKEEF